MKKGKYYINGIGLISPQKTFDNSEFLLHPKEYETNVLTCITPDFKNYINPIQLRRLSRMLRIGLSSAIICTRDSGQATPNGIITATGYGFSESKSSFLEEFLQQNEKQITPTHFIQGSYNGLAGLVALSLNCIGYNNNYVSTGVALETALQDAMLQLNDNDALNFLVGSFDETNPLLVDLNNRTGYYKNEFVSNLQLFKHNTTGALQGEGAGFFSIAAHRSSSTWCSISEPWMLYKPMNVPELMEAMENFLAANQTVKEEVDVFINGASGDVNHDQLINRLVETAFHEVTQARFKHLCGEFCTASSFALWLGASILKKEMVPAIARSNQIESPSAIRKVLIGNQFRGKNYSFMLLERVD